MTTSKATGRVWISRKTAGWMGAHHDVAAPIGQVWSEVTFSLGYAPTKHFEARVEARADKSNRSDAFVTSIDSTSGAPRGTDRQESVAFQGLVKF